MVLDSIQQSSALVAHLVSQSDTVRAILVLADGKEINLIEHYSKNIQELLKDVQQLIKRFKDAQPEANGPLKRLLKVLFRRPTVILDFICNQDHIEDLIKAAKYVESSQHMALTMMMLIYNQASEDDLQGALKKVPEDMITQSKSFKVMQDICRRKETPVVYFRDSCCKRDALHDKNKIFLARHRKASKRCVSTESRQAAWVAGSHSHLAQRQDPCRDAAGTQSSNSIPTTLGQKMNELSSGNAGDFAAEEYIGVMGNDGTFVDMLNDSLYDEEASSLHNDSLSTLQNADIKSSEMIDRDLASEDGADDPFFSETDDFETRTATSPTSRRSSTTIPDSVEIYVEHEALVFVDRAVNITNCRTSTTENYPFCTRSLIVHEDVSPSLILKEPCKPDTDCQHISLHAWDLNLAGQDLPCAFRVSLRHQPIPTSNVNDLPGERRLKLTIIQAGYKLSLRTLVFSKQGACKQYSINTPLEVVSVFEVNENDEEGESDPEGIRSSGNVPSSDSQSESTINVNGQDVKGESNADDDDKAKFSLREFSSPTFLLP